MSSVAAEGSSNKVRPVRPLDGLGVEALIESVLTWDYTSSDARLRRLYDNNKTPAWNASTDIDWSLPVEFGSPLKPLASPGSEAFSDVLADLIEPSRWDAFRWEYQAWMVNQFLHGEQGALVAAARLVETMGDIDAKLYAAVQVSDEARHVEAYSRYVNEKLGVTYPVTSGLGALLQNIMTDSRWDMVYLGMQVIVEGLGLVGARIASTSFNDPVVKQISKNVARDEARHVAFGMVSLQGLYLELTTSELSDRDEFLCESLQLMSRRFLLEDLWPRVGVPTAKGMEYAKMSPAMVSFRHLLFHKVVQLLRQLGLLSERVRAVVLSEDMASARAIA